MASEIQTLINLSEILCDAK